MEDENPNASSPLPQDEGIILPSSKGEILLYQTEDGRTRVECRFQEETIWMTQAAMAELFQMTTPNVNIHLRNIYGEGELAEEATVKDYLIVRSEGARQVERRVNHYNREAILAVGYRVRSQRGTQFQQSRRADVAACYGDWFMRSSPWRCRRGVVPAGRDAC